MEVLLTNISVHSEIYTTHRTLSFFNTLKRLMKNKI